MSQFLCYRDLNGRLIPCNESGQEAVRKVAVNDVVMVEMRRPRNIQWHRKMFALFNLLYQNQSRYPTMDDLRSAMLVYIGFCTEIKLKDDRVVYVPKSLSFAKLSQEGFEQVWQSLVRVACEKIIPNMKEEDLQREIAEIVS